MPDAPGFTPPETFNIADYFLDDRIREGHGDRRAILTEEGSLTYADVQTLANLYGNLLLGDGVQPEQRVMIALPDGPQYAAALFGVLKIGAVVAMVNPHAKPDEIAYFYRYTRATALFVGSASAEPFQRVASELGTPRHLYVADTPEFEETLAALSPDLTNFPSHRDDAAIWLFSGGTTGRPKAVVQTHTAFANTTECYAKGVIGYREDDVTLSVPKLFFGYATGSNLLFPFAVGATAALFPDRCTPEILFDRIERFRPTILVNVPTMVSQMLSDPGAADRDLSSLRVATSAGEALPAELHRRWDAAFGVELLDGLGTAEMWHIFLSNRPGDVRPGTLGRVVPGFEVRVCDEGGRELPDGEVGWLWVRGNSRAIGYWQQMEKSREAFRGEWYVSGDMIVRDPDGYFTYCGRGDDMLKVKGKWLSPKEVEGCLLEHPAVRECAVVGATDVEGLMSPHAFVVPAGAIDDDRVGEDRRDGDGTDDDRERVVGELTAFVKERLASYKCPRRITVTSDLPRTHLGKVDRGALRTLAERAERAEGGVS